jgi:hypothetical protein
MQTKQDPWKILGVARTANLQKCSEAFEKKMQALAPQLISAHAAERDMVIAQWAALVGAWAAIASGEQ